MPHTAVYTGTFDPITLGHLNVISRGSRLVEKLIVGVGVNVEKQPMFSAKERVKLIRDTTKHLTNVDVQEFDGLAVKFLQQCNAKIIIRGIRTLTDMEHEFTMTLANRKLDPSIETVFLMADEEFSHISSSLIKQIASLAGDDQLVKFVPEEIIPSIREKIDG